MMENFHVDENMEYRFHFYWGDSRFISPWFKTADALVEYGKNYVCELKEGLMQMEFHAATSQDIFWFEPLDNHKYTDRHDRDIAVRDFMKRMGEIVRYAYSNPGTLENALKVAREAKS